MKLSSKTYKNDSARTGNEESADTQISSSMRGSGNSAVTVLMFSVLSFFGAEILTGSTSVEGIMQFPLSFFASLAFYGFQVAIIADVSARFRLGMRTIYLLGLFYGIMEEGFAIFTMESTGTHTLWLSLIGLNATWTIYVMILHAVITVSTPILIIRALWPNRISRPFLSRGNYAVMIPVIVAIYPFLMISSIASGRVPGMLPIAILIAFSILILLAARRSRNILLPGNKSQNSPTGYVAYGAIPLAIGMTVPFLVGNRFPIALIPETVLLAALLFYFYLFFRKMDYDRRIHRRTMWAIYTSFYVVMLVGGIFNRTIISDFLGIAATILLVILGAIRTSHRR